MFKFFAIGLAALALLASCENILPEPAPAGADTSVTDGDDDSADAGSVADGSVDAGSVADSAALTIHFTAEAAPATRTAFGDKVGSSYPTLWTANDSKVRISYRAILAESVVQNQSKQADVDPGAGYTSAEFSVSFDALPVMDSVVFYSVSPANAHSGFQQAATTSTIAVPTGQTPIEGSPDERAQILAAKSARFTSAPSSVSFSFSHVTAYGRMSILNLDCGTETVESIVMTAEDNWVGSYTYYYNTLAMTESSASKVLTLTTSSLTDVWFACAPVDLGGKTINVAVNTDGGVYEKEITIPSGRKFSAGKIASFSVDMDGILKTGSKVYSLVTDVTDLTENSEVIIVSSTTDYAMSTTQNTNNRGVASIVKSGSNINNPSADVEVFTLVAGTESNSLSFQTSGDEYIYAAGSDSNNYLRTTGTKDANGSWNISITDTGVATIKAQGTNTNNWMRYYESGGNRAISCYSSGQKNVSIYKLSGSGNSTVLVREVCADPAISCSANTVTITCATAGATIHYTSDGTTPTALSPTYSTPFAIGASCTVKAIAMKDKYISSAIVPQDCAYRANVTYTITSKTEASVSSGAAPTGSSAAYTQTGNTQGKMQNGENTTLTLTGYDAKTIKAITLSMKSLTKAGAGNLSVTAGVTTIASITGDPKFNSVSWYGAWSTEYVDIPITLSNSTYEIGDDENVVITISGTDNSLYIQSYTIEYE